MFETFIGIGIIISLIYYEFTHLSPGGLITPGYLALFVDQPIRILTTFIVAYVIFLIISFLKRYLPIYGRRQFAFTVTFAILIRLLFKNQVAFGDISVTINSIGVIIPGLIANDMIKQSVVKTLYSTGFVVAIMFCILLFMSGSF